MWHATLCCLLALPSAGVAYNVLVQPAFGGSHMMYFGELAKALAARGHNVTWLTSSRLRAPTGVREAGVGLRTFPTTLDEAVIEEGMKGAVQAMYSASFLSKLSGLIGPMLAMMEDEENLYADADTMRFLREADIDFIVNDLGAPPHLVLPYLLGKPFGYFGVSCPDWAAKSPESAAFVPNTFVAFSDRMTLAERTANLAIRSVAGLIVALLGVRTRLAAEHVPELPPLSLTELAARADLCFRLRDVTVETARPLNPNMVDIGSIMGRPGAPLPDDIAAIVTSAKHGVIIMSFGTMFSDMPEAIIQRFVAVLGTLEQTVLWKYSTEMADLPANVHKRPWLPQNDLLAHDNVKLFITHCGVNGFLETVYHGVPVIGFPLGADQGSNGKVIEVKGYGRVLDIVSFGTADLRAAIDDVINNGTYRANIKAASAIMKSMPSGGDTAAFWIDHVIKHGSNHLRPHAQDMIWYEYLMLDVLFLLLLACYISCKAIKAIWRRCRGRSKSKTD